ncbi:MAG: hypothetical protein WA210_05400 [Burkholderiaceae bacterium]
MQRRELLISAAVAGLPVLPAAAHTPYRQWDIFRKRYLQILTSRTDLEGDALGDQWVAALREQLPLSRALVSRARDLVRIASMLKTDQAKLACLSYADAQAMFAGTPPFGEFMPMPLEALLDSSSHLLVTRQDLPLHHAYLIVAALMNEANALRLAVPLEGKFGMTLHRGARSYAAGDKLEMPPQ